jgi:hypothetical protein
MNMPILYRALAVLALLGIAGHRYATSRKPPNTDRYQQRIREAGERLSTQIGPWVGADAQVPARALALLKPNFMISRRYINIENGLSAGVSLVHCSGAHYMAGHFPGRCYPAQGWKTRSARPRDWKVGDLLITGTEYEFFMDDADHASTMVVANCLLLPGGRIVRDMEGMRQSVAGVGGQASGAGQIQVYFTGAFPPARRDETIITLIDGHRPVIDAILADLK